MNCSDLTFQNWVSMGLDWPKPLQLKIPGVSLLVKAHLSVTADCSASTVAMKSST